MPLRRMDHVGVVVEDLAAATDFFLALGMELQGEAEVEGAVVDKIIGLGGARSKIAMLRTPDGKSCVELTEFQSPASPRAVSAPANAPGLRHLAFAVDDLDATLAALRRQGAEPIGGVERFGGFRLCYLGGPAGVIVEIAEKVE